jgi:hypothetical protein
MLTDNLVYPPQADPRPTRFSLLTSNFSLSRPCSHKLKMSNEPNLHNFFTISLHFLTSPSSGQGNPNESRRLLKMPNEPNFQTPRLPVTLDMIRTYNDTCPNKHKKSKPNPNPMQTRSKPNANPKKAKPNPTKPNSSFGLTFPHFFSNRPKTQAYIQIRPTDFYKLILKNTERHLSFSFLKPVEVGHVTKKATPWETALLFPHQYGIIFSSALKKSK